MILAAHQLHASAVGHNAKSDTYSPLSFQLIKIAFGPVWIYNCGVNNKQKEGAHIYG